MEFNIYKLFGILAIAIALGVGGFALLTMLASIIPFGLNPVQVGALGFVMTLFGIGGYELYKEAEKSESKQ